jgi:hypothetical protein
MAQNTGKKITRRSWDVIPLPDTVIARVNALETDQPEQLIFTDRRGRPIGDVEIPGVMDFEEEDDDDAKCQYWIQKALMVSSAQDWTLQGKPHKLLRLMTSTFHNLIHL